MKAPLEKELKLHLGCEGHHDYLLRALSRKALSPKHHHQLNIFFDTEEGLLRKKRLALRVRKEDENYFLTAKGASLIKNTKNSPVSVREEVECRLPETEALLLLRSPAQVCLGEKFPPMRWISEQTGILLGKTLLKEILRFENERHSLPLRLQDRVVTFELDKTHYSSDRTSFELEVEMLQEEAVALKTFLEPLFQKGNIPWKISEKSKFQKALEYLKT